MPRVGFVVNPTAGGGRALAAWHEVQARHPEAEVFMTAGPGGGTDAAKAAVAAGCERVAALGGDGTVSEVANALIGTETPMAVVPYGTGNDYARTIDVPQDTTLAAQLAFGGEAGPVDVGLCLGHRHFVNIAGVGFDAEVMTRFNNPGPVAKVLPVKARYYLSILQTFAKYKGVTAHVTMDGESREIGNLLLMAVGCARYYGAGMHILPQADLNDGHFDVVWGHNVKLGDLNKLMALIYEGRHIGHPNVDTARCREVTVTTQPSSRFHLDGDVTGLTSVTFRSVPAALFVVRPSV